VPNEDPPVGRPRPAAPALTDMACERHLVCLRSSVLELTSLTYRDRLSAASQRDAVQDCGDHVVILQARGAVSTSKRASSSRQSAVVAVLARHATVSARSLL